MSDAVMKHPDFIVMVGGNNVTGDCLQWKLSDLEEGMSSLVVVLDNTDEKYDGKIKIGSYVAIRFGHYGNLSPQVAFRILKKRPDYNTERGRTITVTGMDATQLLSAKTGRGHQPGTKVKANIDQIGKEAGVNIDHGQIKDEGDEPKLGDCARMPMPAGTTCDEQLQGIIDGACPIKKEEDSVGIEVFQKSAREGAGKLTENREATAGIKPKDKHEQNRVNNANKRAKSTGIKGSLLLVGYPHLRAKECVTILNVGSEGSGKWYVQNCRHSWAKNHGYRTSADLLRGKIGKGKDDAPQPMVFYAEIYKSGDQVYAGPRKVDAPSQMTFRYGDGSYIMNFSWEVDAQTGRGAGKKVEGNVINPDKASDPIEEVESEEEAAPQLGD